MKKQSIVAVAIVAVVLIAAVGYALFSQSIDINGTAKAGANFDVQFTNVGTVTKVGYTQVTPEGQAATPIAKISNDGHTLTVTVNKLNYPGAYVEIPVTITNVGTVKAKLESIEDDLDDNESDINVSYSGSVLDLGSIDVEETQTINVKAEWDAESKKTSDTATFNIKLNYVQDTQ